MVVVHAFLEINRSTAAKAEDHGVLRDTMENMNGHSQLHNYTYGTTAIPAYLLVHSSARNEEIGALVNVEDSA